MHQGILAARAEIARMRIAAQLLALGAQLGRPVNAGAIAAVQGRDRLERAMKQHEAIAACLDELLIVPEPEPEPEAEPAKRKRSPRHGVSE